MLHAVHAARLTPSLARSRLRAALLVPIVAFGPRTQCTARAGERRERISGHTRGRATEAALRALAEALGVPRRSLTLVAGATGRDKLVAVQTPPNGLIGRLSALRAGGKGRSPGHSDGVSPGEKKIFAVS
jgi:Uncharacterised ACR, YggU family COG1872